MSLLIAKVGGSLFDLPGLTESLRAWMKRQPEDRVLLVPGGADLVEALRKYAPLHGLDEPTAHWLAVRTLTISARLLQSLLPEAGIIGSEISNFKWQILDSLVFLEDDEQSADCLPKSWDVTTDSIAGQAATRFKASRLVLLKSCSNAFGTDWQAAADAGYVDRHFPKLNLPCPVEAVDFRQFSMSLRR